MVEHLFWWINFRDPGLSGSQDLQIGFYDQERREEMRREHWSISSE